VRVVQLVGFALALQIALPIALPIAMDSALAQAQVPPLHASAPALVRSLSPHPRQAVVVASDQSRLAVSSAARVRQLDLKRLNQLRHDSVDVPTTQRHDYVSIASQFSGAIGCVLPVRQVVNA